MKPEAVVVGVFYLKAACAIILLNIKDFERGGEKVFLKVQIVFNKENENSKSTLKITPTIRLTCVKRLLLFFLFDLCGD